MSECYNNLNTRRGKRKIPKSTTKNGKYLSYLRVSTQRQGRSGLGIKAQREAIAGYLNGGKWELIEEIVEVESGKRNNRPELARALSLCRLHHATLIVAKIDRLARNVTFISALMDSAVDFVAVDLPEANRLTVHIMAAMAEHEADVISARTKAALAAAKARGTKLGGYRWAVGSIAMKGNAASIKARAEKAAKWASDLRPIIEEIKKAGASSLRQIADALNRRKIPSARGGRWSAVQVRRLECQQ